MYNDQIGVLIRAKDFPIGERRQRGPKDGAGDYDEVSLEKNLELCRSSPARG